MALRELGPPASAGGGGGRRSLRGEEVKWKVSDPLPSG